ncbi:hypothetical protein L7F22_024974 [Adiantum nelumboides]|nr:hypothetical protein [Adiantum nelumboides]
MSSSGDPIVGLLVHLRSLLWAIGILREQIAEDMQDYERLSLADLEATIIRLQEILRPVCLDEGSSRHPHAGRNATPFPDPTEPPTQPAGDGGLTQAHTETGDQSKMDKKFVMSHLEREFGKGWSHKKVLQDMAHLLQYRRDNARRQQLPGFRVGIHLTWVAWGGMVSLLRLYRALKSTLPPTRPFVSTWSDRYGGRRIDEERAQALAPVPPVPIPPTFDRLDDPSSSESDT